MADIIDCVGLLVRVIGIITLCAVPVLVYNTPEIRFFRGPLDVPAFSEQKPKVFDEIAPGVFKMTHHWHQTPIHQECLDIYMVQEGKSWFLTDAGGYDNWLAPHATQLVDAVKQRMGRGESLKYILLTHGHWDHVGALEPLLALYPRAKVVMHEAEAAYLVHGEQYETVSERSLGKHVLVRLKLVPDKQAVVPEDRAVIVTGQDGSLSHLGIRSLHFYHTPGHAPGHIVFLHKPSGYLLAGDLTDVIVKDNTTQLMLLSFLNGSVHKTGIESLCAAVYNLPYTRILPYHDATKRGFSKPEMINLVESYANCSGLATAARAAEGDNSDEWHSEL